MRIVVMPKEAEVFVDGYHAGTVDDFDGVFQRLHLIPGEHEIAIYLDGYRTIREQLYVGPGSTRTLERQMEKLSPGEPQGPRPSPVEPPDASAPARLPLPPRGGPPPVPFEAPPARAAAPPAGDSRFGTLVIAVRPSDAVVQVDGEEWKGPSRDERLVVQVPEGRHRVEVRKDGYRTHSMEIDLRRGGSEELNVSLDRLP
jgi:hypothetical protein